MALEGIWVQVVVVVVVSALAEAPERVWLEEDGVGAVVWTQEAEKERKGVVFPKELVVSDLVRILQASVLSGVVLLWGR